MSPDSPVDLSPLDPARDRDRWEALVARVVAHAVAHTRRLTIAGQLAAWARPVLALAAALAFFAWAGAALAPHDAATVQSGAAETLTDWAVDGTTPTTTQVLELMEAHHGS